MPEPRSRLIVVLSFLLLPLIASVPEARSQEADSTAPDVEPGAPYVPTPMNVVEEMLRLAAPSPRDTLYDLGSGDGRLPITAARLYGARGVGVELDSGLVARSRRHARGAGVDSLVRFVRGDLFETDLRPATVVTLYLFPDMNRRLRPKILRQMEPGARVVAHDFSMGEWRADSVVRVQEGSTATDLFEELDGDWSALGDRTPDLDSLLPEPRSLERRATVYLWIVPADVDGTWELRLPDGGAERVEIDQRFQELRLGGKDGAGAARVHADSVALTLEYGGETVRLRGTVRGDRMEGRTPDGGTWSARRLPGTGGSVLEWEEPGADEGGRGSAAAPGPGSSDGRPGAYPRAEADGASSAARSVARSGGSGAESR